MTLFFKFQRDVEEQFSGLQTLTNTRLYRLKESKQLHQYLREVSETAEWITEQLHVAAAEDYGKDFEHLEVYMYIIKKLKNQRGCVLFDFPTFVCFALLPQH